MQFVRNNGQTSLTIKRYVGYDKAKKRSAVETVGTIQLVPEVPTSVPAAIAGNSPPSSGSRFEPRLGGFELSESARP